LSTEGEEAEGGKEESLPEGKVSRERAVKKS
jgi:hypothetical protein